MRTTRFQVSVIFLEEVMYPLLLLFLKYFIIFYLQFPKICKLGKGTTRYGGYKVVLKISGEERSNLHKMHTEQP